MSRYSVEYFQNEKKETAHAVLKVDGVQIMSTGKHQINKLFRERVNDLALLLNCDFLVFKK